MKRRHWLALVTGAAGLLVVAGCGSDDGSGPPSAGSQSPSTGMHSGMHSSGMHASGMHAAAKRGPSRAPTETASMVCDEEIRGDVARVFQLAEAVAGTSTWQRGLFTCTYQLPGGPLTLAVEDSPDESEGRAYFDHLRSMDGSPALLKGLQAFGLPAYESADGRVVFLKDGKTLAVDAGALPRVAGPGGESRTEVAYAVAADVVGCWSE